MHVVFCRPFRAQQQRHLQDSDSCSLSIFAETLNFTSCQRLTTDSSDAQLLWTLQHREVCTACCRLGLA